MITRAAPAHSLARRSCSKGSPGMPVAVKQKRMQAKVSSKAVPSTLSLAETEDACKYAQVAKLAYESNKDLVLDKLHKFVTPDGAKPFSNVTADDIILINCSTNLLGRLSRLVPALQTDTEVLFIRVPAGFDNDPLAAKGDQLIVGFRGTEVAVSDGFMSDLLTDISAVRTNIRSMKGLPPDSLTEPKYDKVMVHSGFLTSFNDLMTGGDKADAKKSDKKKTSKEEVEQILTMDEAAAKLLKGQAPARVVCCGHSLGAALATLGAFWWAKKFPEVEVFCYAFASPRVGNQEFCNDFLERGNSVAEGQVDKAFRFTHKGDLVPAVPPPWLFGYSHVEKSVFLLEPKERTWGVLDVDKVPLPEGQTYLALLAQRPTDYLLYRARNPIDSTKASYHDMGAHLRGLQNILEYSRSKVTASAR